MDIDTMKTIAILLSFGMVTSVGGMARAQTVVQSDMHAAPGVVAPDLPRAKLNGDVSPPPSLRANGGVGATEQPYSGTQTLSGGPAGGQNNQQ
jgi:hypothetical protein